MEKVVGFTEAERKDFQDVCRLVDLDKSGTLEMDEFNQVIRALGIRLNEQEFQTLRRSCCKEGQDNIDNDEFVRVMELQNNKQEYEVEMLECFRAIDKNGDGFIATEDLAQLFRVLGLKGYDEEKAMSIIDADSDGYVSYDEFLKFLIAK